MFFFKVIFTVAVVSLFAACNSGSSSGKTLTPEEVRQQEINRVKNAPAAFDYTTEIQADRFDLQKANLQYPEVLEMYQDGCKEPGKSSMSAPYQLDPSLKVGTEFTREFAVSELLREISWNKTNAVVISVSSQQVMKEVNYEFLKLAPSAPFNSPDEIFVSRPHMTETRSYEFKTDGSYPKTHSDSKYNLSQSAMNWLSANQTGSSTAWSCSVRSQAASGTAVTDKGFYLVMGRLVPSYRSVSISKGDVICKNYSTQKGADLKEDEETEINLGPGTSTYIKIVSNHVGTEEWTQCGGHELFHSTKTQLDSGKVLNTWVEKYTKLPLK